MNEIETQTAKTIETLEKKKKEKDWLELYAKMEESKMIAQERYEWKKKCNELLVILKEEENKHQKDL